ncbi:hypothetical protein ACIGFJ_13555 [Brevundimonas diminuta]|uniref:hypothetical protein n=1 Tax=Brevundimonas diminuta TaxID=293 RepID=UPI0037CC6E3D
MAEGADPLLHCPMLQRIALPLRRPKAVAGEADRSGRGGVSDAWIAGLEDECAQEVFRSVEVEMRALQAIWIDTPPTDLNALLERLAGLDRKQGRGVADRLVREMAKRGGFGFSPTLAAALSHPADMGRHARERTQIWREARGRHLAGASTCAEVRKRFSHPLWRRLEAMHTTHACHFEALLIQAGEEA